MKWCRQRLQHKAVINDNGYTIHTYVIHDNGTIFEYKLVEIGSKVTGVSLHSKSKDAALNDKAHALKPNEKM